VSERYLKAFELAEHFGVSLATVLDWWEAEKIPGYRLFGDRGPVRFLLSDVEAALVPFRRGPAPSNRALRAV
jgi:hypothetical protein